MEHSALPPFLFVYMERRSFAGITFEAESTLERALPSSQEDQSILEAHECFEFQFFGMPFLIRRKIG